jgi:hypothetical protein
MTYSVGQTAFSPFKAFCRAAVVIALLAPAGCAGGNAAKGGSQASSTVELQGPKDTGAFPNLNIPPKSAAPQLTSDQTKTKLAELKADQSGQSSPGATPSPSDAATLSTLAKTHAGDTLKSIEGKCDPTLDQTCK